MPFAGYPDFDACVAANSDKSDPKGYCATIMRDAEKGRRIPITKLNEAEHKVYGWASVVTNVDGTPVVDYQGDVIALAELEKSMAEFMANSREANEMHAGGPTGTVFEAFVGYPEKYEAMGVPAEVATTLPVGAWIGVQTDPDTFAKVKAGIYRMFSIEGTAIREAV